MYFSIPSAQDERAAAHLGKAQTHLTLLGSIEQTSPPLPARQREILDEEILNFLSIVRPDRLRPEIIRRLVEKNLFFRCGVLPGRAYGFFTTSDRDHGSALWHFLRVFPAEVENYIELVMGEGWR